MAVAELLVVFSGLIAFVPGHRSHPERLTAYLLDVADHEATLRVRLSDLSNSACPTGCETPERDPENCDCRLTNHRIEFTSTLEGIGGHIRPGPSGDLPDADNALHLSWVPRLANVGGSNALSPSKLAKKSYAWVSFPWGGTPTTCAFDEEDTGDEDKRRVYSIDFRPLGGASQHTQAVAELLAFKVDLDSLRPRIRIVSLSGEPTRELKLECDRVCPVAILNNMVTEPDCETCEDERCSIGNHFFHYYGLLGTQPVEKPLPHRNCDKYVDLNAAPVEACSNLVQFAGRAVSNRVICPMAILDP